MATALESPSQDAAFAEFCERHAVQAAADFSKQCVNFLANKNMSEARAALTHKDFLKKFIECFSNHFEVDFCKRRVQGNRLANGSAKNEEDCGSEPEESSPKMHHKPFLRRFSLKMLRKGRDLFNKQHSDDDSSHGKTKLSNIIVECRKEGIVNYSTPESLDGPGGPPKWEKCKLLLAKAVGGYMLEFYCPPKSTKPRSGVFCALISEARETTALEMPDHENTFVLKAQNNMEFVIEAQDAADMKKWLCTIQYCMRVEPGHDGNDRDHHGDAPELPPRHLGRGADRLSSSSNFDADNPDANGPESDIGQTLKKEFWFHGTLKRSDAAQLVLHEGADGHGLFLVRQSETRSGEFVLTFNFMGRAKHLRITISDQGRCSVQQFCFQSIYEMLEHFRQTPIPLESGDNSDVTLTDYVVNPAARSQLQGSIGRNNAANPNSTNANQNQLSSVPIDSRRAPPIPEIRQVQTHSGSVRTQETTLEQITESSTRAVENQYSFV